MTHKSTDELEAALGRIRRAPADDGVLRMIVRRPDEGERELLESGQLDADTGLVGDNWSTRGSRRTSDGSSHPDMQLNLMGARVIDVIAGSEKHWPLAGDQLFVDFDLSEANVPAGTRLAIGQAVIEITDQPHTGCKKFVERFGRAALDFVNSPVGQELHLRGVNARVVSPGGIRNGDRVRKVAAPDS